MQLVCCPRMYVCGVAALLGVLPGSSARRVVAVLPARRRGSGHLARGANTLLAAAPAKRRMRRARKDAPRRMMHLRASAEQPRDPSVDVLIFRKCLPVHA